MTSAPHRMPLVAPSILSADFANLQADIERAQGADWLHVDVMDNHFVPNLTIGLPVVRAIRRVTDIPLDCHLMIDDPDRWAVGYAEAGAFNVTVHAEAVAEPVSLAMDLKAAGAAAGLSIKPGTDLDDWVEVLRSYDTLLIMTVEPGFGGQEFMDAMLEKIRRARAMVDTGHLNLMIEVDGGINADTVARAAEAGADCFVAGSAIYGARDPSAAIEALRRRATAVRHAVVVGEDGDSRAEARGGRPQ